MHVYMHVTTYVSRYVYICQAAQNLTGKLFKNKCLLERLDKGKNDIFMDSITIA